MSRFASDAGVLKALLSKLSYDEASDTIDLGANVTAKGAPIGAPAPGGGSTVAPLLVSLPLVVDPDADIAVASLELEPGLYQLAMGVAGQTNADPGFLGGMAVLVFPDPVTNGGHERAPAAAAGAINMVCSLDSFSGDSEAGSDSNGHSFFAVEATALTARAQATSEAGGSLTSLVLVATRLG